MADTPYRNEALEPPVIEPKVILPDTLLTRVTIAPYKNIAAGDRVRLRWGVAGNELTHEVQAGDERLPIEFLIDRTMIDQGGFGDEIEVVYDITDLVYNWSLWSPPTLSEVEPPDALDAPWVSPTVDDEGTVIDVALLDGDEVTVEIYGLKKDDVVRAHFVGTTAAGEPSSFDSEEQTVTVAGRPVYFALPHALFPSLVQGSCAIGYTVKRGGAGLISARRRLTVIGRRDTLEAPSIVEAIGNQVDPASGAVTIRVDANPLIVAGTRVAVELYGRTAGDVPVSHADNRDVGTGTPFPLYFVVPGEKIAALAGSTFTISYTVETRDPLSGAVTHHVGAPHGVIPSPSRTYRVSGASRTLPVPVVPVAEGDRLDPGKVNDLVGLEVDVSYAGMAADDKVTFSFIGTKYTTP